MTKDLLKETPDLSTVVRDSGEKSSGIRSRLAAMSRNSFREITFC